MCHWHAWLLAWHLLHAAVLQEAEDDDEEEEETEEESSLSEALEGVHVGDEVASAARQLSKKQQALVACSLLVQGTTHGCNQLAAYTSGRMHGSTMSSTCERLPG